MLNPEPPTILRGALLGCGHVAPFHLRAWAEIEGVEIVALANRTVSKAEALAREFGIPLAHVYGDHRELLDSEAKRDPSRLAELSCNFRSHNPHAHIFSIGKP